MRRRADNCGACRKSLQCRPAGVPTVEHGHVSATFLKAKIAPLFDGRNGRSFRSSVFSIIKVEEIGWFIYLFIYLFVDQFWLRRKSDGFLCFNIIIFLYEFCMNRIRCMYVYYVYNCCLLLLLLLLLLRIWKTTSPCRGRNNWFNKSAMACFPEETSAVSGISRGVETCRNDEFNYSCYFMR